MTMTTLKGLGDSLVLCGPVDNLVKGLEVPKISDTKTPLPTQARALLGDPRSIEGSFGLKNVLARTLRL